jgi:hypothetical protein
MLAFHMLSHQQAISGGANLARSLQGSATINLTEAHSMLRNFIQFVLSRSSRLEESKILKRTPTLKIVFA